MELVDKTGKNRSNDDSRQLKSNVIPENSKNVCAPRKKFCNTVFATKMRNRKNVDKLQKLNTEEVFTSCKKAVSIDVTRLSSNIMPKLVTSVDHKNRKRKRYQWKLGILTKKFKRKKPCDSVNINSPIKEKVIENSNDNVSSTNIESSKNLENENEEKTIKVQDKLYTDTSKADSQRRKSRRYNMNGLNDKLDAELQPDFGMHLEDNYSCRRTEPFIGKLNTKKARCQNLNNILKLEMEIIQLREKTKMETVENKKTDSDEKNESKNLENSEVLENTTIIKNKNKESNEITERDQNIQDCDSKKHTTVTGDKYKATEKIELDNQESKILPVTKSIETKDVTVEIVSCRRTMPFVGKTPRKCYNNMSEGLIQAGCSNSDLKTKVDSACEDINKKLHSSSINEIDNQNSSKDNNECLANSNLSSESSGNNSEIKSQTVVIEAVKSSNMNEKLNESMNNVCEKEVNINNDTNSKSDNPSKKVESKSDEVPVNDPKENFWSCRRTNSYEIKDSSHCSRTLPFISTKNKKKALNISVSTTDSSKIENKMPENVPDGLLLNKEKDSTDQLDQCKETNIPVIQEDALKSVSNTCDATANERSTSMGNLQVENEDWKFKRKRTINLSDNEKQIEKENPSKKLKIKSPVKTMLPDKKKSNIVAESPDNAICSWMSFNCTKHTHNHLDINNCLVSNNESKDVCVSLFKLEDSKDPLVVDYLKKTEFNYKSKKNSSFLIKNIDESSILDTNLDDAALQKHETKDLPTFVIPEIVNKINSDNDETANILNAQDNINAQTEMENSYESVKGSKTKTRRKTFSTSSDSLNCGYSKRKKNSVNYLENFSDSDSESSNSFTMSLRTRAQSRGPVLRCRNNLRSCSIDQTAENDLESYKSLNSGLKRRRKIVFESDENETDNENSKIIETLKQNSEINNYKIDDSQSKSIQEEIANFVEQNIKETLAIPINNQNKNQQDKKKQDLDVQFNKQADLSSFITESNNTSLTTEKTSEIEMLVYPTKSLPSICEQSTSTPKSSNNYINASDKILRTSKSGDTLYETPKKALCSLQRNEKNIFFNKNRSSAPLNSLLHVWNHNSIKLRDLKVQLIKLETVCESFEDYSASEIETLTEKYIDLLMNSNFSSDTWRKPINYYKSRNEKYTHQVDDSFIPNIESHDVHVQFENCDSTEEIESVIVTPSIESFIDQSYMDTSSPNYCISTATSLDTQIIAFVEHTENSEQRNFGAVNISDALSVPANNEKDKEKTAMVNQIEINEENMKQIEENQINQSDLQTASIVVNGQLMFSCSTCNKICVNEDLLKQHIKDEHENSFKSLNDAITKTAGKSNETEISETKRQSAKYKKKHSYYESLRCTICSVLFDSKESLFDHIMTHNEHELQEAYKTAKAKAKKHEKEKDNSVSENSDKEQEHDVHVLEGKKKKKKKEKTKRKSTESIRNSRSSTEIEDLPKDDTRLTSIQRTSMSSEQHDQQQDVDLVDNCTAVQVISDTRPTAKSITICPCHAHETTNQDLQIEMVLFCKTCYVIFRRRECFEVHYRTSIECRHKRTNNEITKVPRLFCSGCPYVLGSLMEMRAHLEMHAKQNCQGTVTFICNICKVAFYGVGGIFYSHWFNHTKSPNFVASRHSFPKLSVVSVLEDSNVAMTTTKSQEGFFYIAEHVCRLCRLPFNSEPELQRHKLVPCQIPQLSSLRLETHENNRLQMIKLICDLCKKYYVNKENFDRHCIERNHLKTPIAKFSRLPININEQTLVCSLCKVANNTLDNMKEHWKRIHSPIMELYTCKTCNIVPSNDVTNYTYDKFEKHCRLFHKSEVITCLVYFVTARYVCNICRFGFETEKSLKDHQIVHQKKSNAPAISNIPTNSISANTPMISALTSILCDPQLNNAVNSRHAAYVPNSCVQPNSDVQMSTSSYIETPTENFSSDLGNTNEMINMSSSTITPARSVEIASLTNSSNANTLLRSMLVPVVEDQSPQLNQIQPSVETILIDSRSNSPVMDKRTSDNDNLARTNESTVDPPIVPQKSYMTKVNPNFESILGTNIQNNDAASSGNFSLEGSNLSLKNNARVSQDSLQPFEVVLLTDDLNDNSNSVETETSNKVVKMTDTSMSNITILNQQQNQSRPASAETSESSTKSFLRVRSIAELQRIKIHLCSMCGLSFDTPHALELHLLQHNTTLSQIPNEIGRATPVQMISPMVSQNRELTNAKNALLSQMKQKMTMLPPNNQRSSNNLDMNARMSPSVLPNVPHLHQQQRHRSQQQHQLEQQYQVQQQYQSQQQHQTQIQNEYRYQTQPSQQGYWFASCNGMSNNMSPNLNYNSYVNQQQQQIGSNRRLVNHVNSEVSGNYATYRSAPPPYPGNSNSLATGRISAIQLPERNAPGSSSPTKRPSGAATRIPQQSLPSFEALTEYRQPGIRMPPFNCNSIDQTNSRNDSSNDSRRHLHVSTPNFHFSGKTYSRNSNDTNYSSNSNNLSKNSHPQPESKFIYTCKEPNCNYRTEYTNLFRAHEKTHTILHQPNIVSTNSQMNISQQQRHPMKHVPVSQMPERTRHALPNAVPNTRNSVIHNTNKRLQTNRELVEHVMSTHNATNQLCCYICDYCTTPQFFETEDTLREHMNILHNYFCKLCNKRYPSKQLYMLHDEVHARNPC